MWEERKRGGEDRRNPERSSWVFAMWMLRGKDEGGVENTEEERSSLAWALRREEGGGE